MKYKMIVLVHGVFFILAAGCTEQTPSTPPAEESRAVLEPPAPLAALGVYLDGLHFRNGQMDEQMDVHHYCGALREDLIQCVLFNGNKKGAHMVGVEYVVSARLFESLPKEEKAMWHSHRYEVKSGQLVAPGMDEAAEHALVAKLISTYGKTWHTWQNDPELPLGAPVLMMGFTADGQVKPELVEKRDQTLGISTGKKKAARVDIPDSTILPGADAWQTGNVVQVKLEKK